MKTTVVISGSGVHTPPHRVSNDELVASFNDYVNRYNHLHRTEINAGTHRALQHSSAAFIEKASGIKNRYVIDKSGILDPNRMRPRIPRRCEDEPSIQCELAVPAAEAALKSAGRTPSDVDAVLVSCSNFQRPYPAIAIEIQNALGTGGYAFDMNVACSAATFAMKTAMDAIVSGSARCVLVISPEIMSGHVNYRDRDSHFIFGDVCTALVMESDRHWQTADAFQILGARLKTRFSNNVRNNFGFLNRADGSDRETVDNLFHQNGRRVFKEVVPLAADLITGHLEELRLSPGDIKRLWLHQANINMNKLVALKVLGREATNGDAPVVLDEYANTASAGAVIAFHHHRHDLAGGDIGVLCSFGAGYSAGTLVLQKTVRR